MKKIVPAIFFVVFLVGCTTSTETDSTPKTVDIRQGEEVKRICFASSLNGWREIKGERQSVILTKGVRDEYRLDLSGICDVSRAMNNVATRTRGSSCLGRGDEIIIADGLSGLDRCFIKKIYTWNPDLLKETEDTTTPESKDQEGPILKS